MGLDFWLFDLIKVVDARSKLESQAYAHWIIGTLAFELGQWSHAMKALNNAKAIYEKLASTLNEDESIVYQSRYDFT